MNQPAPTHVTSLLQVEEALTEDFVALLVARNRAGASIPIEELLHRNAIPLPVFTSLLTSPTFVASVKRHVQELTAQGFGVEAKSAVLHEAGLPIVYEILADPSQPALARLKAHEILGTVSGKGDRLRPTTNSTLNVGLNGSGGNGGAYQLVINLGTPNAPDPNPLTLRAPVEKLVHEAVATAERETADLVDPDYVP